jgi:hypothetical protein
MVQMMVRRSLGDVGILKRLWNLRMIGISTSLGLTRRDGTFKLDDEIARRHYIVERLHPCVGKFAAEWDSLAEIQQTKLLNGQSADYHNSRTSLRYVP